MDPNKLQELDPENLRTRLKIEWELFRFQDGLRWSRIQNVGVIEAAILTSSYSHYVTINPLRKLIFATLLSAIVALLCAIGVKDGRDATHHLGKAVAMEKALGFEPFPGSKWVLGVSGAKTIILAIYAVLLLNVLIIIDLLHTCFMLRP